MEIHLIARSKRIINSIWTSFLSEPTTIIWAQILWASLLSSHTRHCFSWLLNKLENKYIWNTKRQNWEEHLKLINHKRMRGFVNCLLILCWWSIKCQSNNCQDTYIYHLPINWVYWSKLHWFCVLGIPTSDCNLYRSVVRRCCVLFNAGFALISSFLRQHSC